MKKMCMKIISNRIISMTVIFAMIFVLFGTGVCVKCHDGDAPIIDSKILKVNRKKGKIVLDGKAKEKAWDNAAVIKNSDFSWGLYEDMEQGKTKSMDTAKKNDVARISSCKILWAPNGLYVYMQVEDTTPCVNAKEDEPMDDTAEYYFDMTNTKSTHYSGVNDASYSLSRGGRISGWGERNHRGFKSKSKSINKGKDGYAQEIFVACDWHGVESLKAGRKVGFDLQIYDVFENTLEQFIEPGDERITRHIVWNSKNLAWTNPYTMGTLVLVDESEKSVAFAKKNVTIKKGAKRTLHLNVVGADKVKFSINNKKIVKTIKKKAKRVTIKGLKKGKVVIRAKIDGKVAKCNVIVK